MAILRLLRTDFVELELLWFRRASLTSPKSQYDIPQHLRAHARQEIHPSGDCKY